jgi:hypothetical protein
MSPGWAGLILAGVLTPQFIIDMGKGYDARTTNRADVEDRRRYTQEDLRQMLFAAHDEMIDAAMRLDDEHAPVLDYSVPIGPGYTLTVADFLWRGAHTRQHRDDIDRAMDVEYTPETLTFIPEIDAKMRRMVLAHDTFLWAVYAVEDDAWGEESKDTPGWTYHDIVAHVSSNEHRRVTRLRSALGETSREELDAISDIEAWNQSSVSERRGWPVRRLVDEYVEGWAEIRRLLSRFSLEDLATSIDFGTDGSMLAGDFLDQMSGHTSRHAGQLVPASRARRL